MRGSSDRVKMTKKPRRAEAWLQINRELINRGPHGAGVAVGEAAALGAAEAGAPRPAGAAEVDVVIPITTLTGLCGSTTPG